MRSFSKFSRRFYITYYLQIVKALSITVVKNVDLVKFCYHFVEIGCNFFAYENHIAKYQFSDIELTRDEFMTLKTSIGGNRYSFKIIKEA